METKTLPGLSKYLIRSDGEIVSIWSGDEKVLSGGTDKDGYRKFVLIDDLGARRYVRRASLVCTAFHGPRPRGKEVRHLDGSRDNDAACNLAWATHAENCGDKIAHGTRQHGARNGNAVLTEDQARQAILRLNNGDSAVEIAKAFGVNRSTIFNIKYRKTWVWLRDQMTPAALKQAGKTEAEE